MKDIQCYELFGEIALKNHAFLCVLTMWALFYAMCAECVGHVFPLCVLIV